MGYIVYFDIAAICILAVILLSNGIRKRLWDLQNKVLVAMIVGNLVLAVTDILSAWLTWLDIPGVRNLLTIVDYSFWIANILIGILFCCYCICLVGRWKQTVFWKRVLLFLPGAVMIAAMIVQLFTDVVFVVDEQLVYHRLGGIFILYGGFVFYGFAGIGYLVRYKRRTSHEARVSCNIFVLVCAASALIQSFYPRMLIETFGISISILLFYLAMEKPEELMDSELKVLNQRAMLKMAESKFQTGEHFPCVMLKVHNLKVMRQTMGADTVLEMLQQVAHYLKENFEDAMIFHFSQSMFVLVLDKKATEQDVKQMIEKIRDRFQQTWVEGERDTRLYIHIAYMQCPGDASDMNTFMNYLQYMRSNSGENRGELLRAADMNIEKRSREMHIRKIVADAMENGGFEVFYQPIYSIGDEKVVSAEALIRLKDQSIGYISPEEFIPIAEQSGAILKIGEFVFESVCKFLHEENLKEYGIRFIEINLSVVQCMQDNLVERLLEIMDKYQIGAEQINLEITETAAAHTTEVLENNIRRLHEEGIHFSLDDYGSGYSNTDYLFHFPFHMVKIDKLILWEACKNEKAMIALRNTIQMIKELGLEVVVEGVETTENVDYLTAQKCDFLQGYYYSKPVPKQRFLELIRQMEQ